MDRASQPSQRPILARFSYRRPDIERGYTGQTLYINLDRHHIEARPVSEEMKKKFIGGRGFGLKLLWDGINDHTRWNDPENELIVAPGPICGITQYPGTGKCYVVGLSPLTEGPYDSNVGGHFAPFLKFAGWDALEIQGKAGRDVIIFIDGPAGEVRIEGADDQPTDTHLLLEEITAQYATDQYDRRHISVISAGRAAGHTLIGALNVSFYDVRREFDRIKQAGRGGLGTVFRDKRLKAVVVRSPEVRPDMNRPANKALIDRAGVKLHREMARLDDRQNRMRHTGTTYLNSIMNDYDLLPCHNFKFGSHPEAHKLAASEFAKYFRVSGHDGCWYGCTMACAKVVEGFELKTGPYKGQRVPVDGPEYETVGGVGSTCGIFDPEYIIECNFYCDTYGVDTISFGTLTGFIMECYEAGILDSEKTGGLELRFGNKEAALELLHQMARGEGFGLIAGQGIRRMKKIFASQYGADPAFLQDIGMECKGLEFSLYMPKESLAQQGGYGLTNKGAQHDEAWLIFMDMVNNQIPTFEDKAEALHYFPMFRTWLSLMGLCKLPWNDIVPEDNKFTDEPAKIPEHVQNYVDLFNGVTGQNIDRAEMIRQSETVY
ncbi:MAG: aldehyde:ferredoxin oxidoreductase, partial [Negativicutes bacterium]|nr:aldehyde:ferredoxin oxidoreductase [Negativicutes bacterium]